jgi:hypothetical protein
MGHSPSFCQRVILSLVAATLQIAFAFGQGSDIKHWELGEATTDADLSPDDRLLAVAVESPPAPQKSREPIVESIQVWDYQQNIKISSKQLASYLNIKPTPNVVRFTADGLLLVATEPTKLYVLEAATLKSIRVIEPPLNWDVRIAAMETGPIGHVAIVGTSGNPMLFAYDLDTGHALFQSSLPHAVSSIAWKQDGTQVAVATPFPCTRFRDTVHVFSTNPWRQLRTLMARNSSSLTFSENHLYVVQTSLCKGSVSNHHLGMQAFDLHTWGREQILLPHKDIHGSVSYAGGILLANTGAIKTKFDWLDAVTSAADADVEFTIWEDDARSVRFKSTPFAVPVGSQVGIRDVQLRLSRTGKMILFNPRNPQVFRVP